jgi:hypothetical protein
MSKMEDAVLSLALGAGGGLVLWYLFRDDKADAAAARPPGRSAAPPAVPRPLPLPPPRVAGACSLKLDASGLTADGDRVDVAGAVERCKRAGRAELVFAKDCPAAVYVELNQALARAGVPVTVRSP